MSGVKGARQTNPLVTNNLAQFRSILLVKVRKNRPRILRISAKVTISGKSFAEWQSLTRVTAWVLS